MKNFIYYIKNSHLTSTQLASKTNISEDRLNLLLDNSNVPSYTELRSLSEVLNFPISFLLSEHKEESTYEVLFRKQLGSAPDQVVINNFNYFVENILELKQDVSKVENIQNIIKPAENTFQNAEKMADSFREVYLDGNYFEPVTNLPELLSNKLNFIVKVQELGKNADGASASINGLTFLLVSPRFEARMLFTLAHELAHVINHHEQGDYVYFDNTISLRPKDDKSKIEGFANAFASCLLLPKQGIAALINKVREIYQLSNSAYLSDIEILYISRFYGVSFDVAAFRCETLNLLPVGGASSLSTKLKEDFGSPEKRADNLGLPQRESINFPLLPDFVLQRAVELIEEGTYSIGKIADMLGVPVNTILEYNSKID